MATKQRTKKPKQTEQPDLEWGQLYRTPDGQLHQYFPLHKYQRQVMESKKRFVVALAGTGGGKSALTPIWILQELRKNPKSVIIVVSPIFPMLIALQPGIVKILEESEFKGTFNKSDRIYECSTGGSIHFKSASDPNTIQGLHCDVAIMDEAGMMKKEAYDVIRQRCNRKKGRILITSTPYHFNWLFHDVYQAWKAGDEDIDVIQFNSLENPTYDKEAFEKERKLLPEWKFKMMYLGEFTKPAGVIFENFDKCIVGQIPPMKTERLVFVGGIDWGFNDETACMGGFIHKNILYLFNEIYEKKKTVDDIMAYKNFNEQTIWFCDNQRKDSILTLKRNGYLAKKTKKYNGSVLDNIARLTRLINSGRIQILGGSCPNLENEMANYVWKEDEKGITDQPVDKNNHAIDALCYLVEGAERCGLLAR
ncbi:Terminase-like family protein [Polystyrenella longa]|uniref:Terminase-like family protein n=2 Tax=Polystyrenella longa TaxID=2528007 RepID=A0A518CQP7_9PLAN|nr:Terminase-like family protein [Polystyrenella longa]